MAQNTKEFHEKLSHAISSEKISNTEKILEEHTIDKFFTGTKPSLVVFRFIGKT